MVFVKRRPTLADLATAAGVSAATVDRVLNARSPVRGPTAERVLRAAEAIGYHAAPLLQRRVRAPERRFGFLLQKPDLFYRQLGQDLEAAAARLASCRGRADIRYVSEISPNAIVAALEELAERCQAIAIVSIDHPRISDAIAALRARGKPVFALISDLSAEARAGFVGRDDRRQGRTAGWLVAHAARKAGKVCIIVGSHRYLCQETAEISFRAYFRESAPQFETLEPLVNLEDSRLAYVATQELLARQPDLVGLYVAGGGVEGVIAAMRDEGAGSRIAFVCNELLAHSRAALLDGVLTAVVSTPTALVAERVCQAMERALEAGLGDAPAQSIVPFEIYLPTNI